MGLKPTTIDRSPASTPLPPSRSPSEAASFKEAASAKETASAKGSLKSRSSSGRAEAGKASNVALPKGSEEAVAPLTQAQQEGEAALKQGMRRRKSTASVKDFTPPKMAPQGGNVGQDDAITPAPHAQGHITSGQVEVPLSSEMQVAVAKWSDQALGHSLMTGFNDREAHAYAKPIMDHARRSAENDVKELLDGKGALQGLHKFWNNTTLASDTSSGKTYRKQLAALQVDDEHPTLTLKAIDDLLDVIIVDIKKLTPDTKEGIFVRDKLLNSAEQLKKTVHRTAFDNPDMNTLLTAALVLGTSLGSVLPFYAAIAGNPFGAYYLVALTNAYTRTIGLTIGMVLGSPALAGREIIAKDLQRHVTWETTPIAFFIAYALLQASVNKGDEAGARAALGAADSGAVIAAAGVVALLAYLVPEFLPSISQLVNEKTASTFEKSKMKDDLEKGRIKLQGQEDVQKSIHQNLEAVTTLVSSVDENRKSFKAAGGGSSYVEDQIMTHMRNDLYNLLHTFEQVRTVGPSNDGQVVNAPGSKAGDKKTLATSLAITGGAMGVVSSLSAIKSPALLSDYISYYVASTVLVAYSGVDPKTNEEDAQRVFINQFSGTAIGLPTVIPNTLTLLLPSLGEGVFDIVKPDVTEIKPPLMGPIPALPGTQHPNLHPLNGAPNLALGIAYQFLTTAVFGTRAGPVVAKGFIASLKYSIDHVKGGYATTVNKLMPGRQATPIGDVEAGNIELVQPNIQQIDPEAGRMFVEHLENVFDVLMKERAKIMGPEPQDEMAAPLQSLMKRFDDVGEPSGSVGPSNVAEVQEPSPLRMLEGQSYSAQQSVVQFDPSKATERRRSGESAQGDKKTVKAFKQEEVGAVSGSST